MNDECVLAMADIDTLNQLLWWLRGYIEALSDELSHTALDEGHISTLTEAIDFLRDCIQAKGEDRQ